MIEKNETMNQDGIYDQDKDCYEAYDKVDQKSSSNPYVL